MEKTINEVFNEISIARDYLKATDYIVIKLSEALANGDDIIELKTTYAEQLAKRKEYRSSIDVLQVELNALNEELKASEEAKNDEAIIEDVIEQPVEETPADTNEVVEEIPSEKPIEETITEEPIEEPVTEVEPSEQPIEDTTEVVENLE